MASLRSNSLILVPSKLYLDHLWEYEASLSYAMYLLMR